MISGVSPKPEGAVVQGDGGVWYKYGITRYAMYYHEGTWRECAQITNEQVKNMLLKEEAMGVYRVSLTPENKLNIPSISVAIRVLNECARLQSEKGAVYDKAGQVERSFSRVAQAFNAITGKNITSAEVCLLLQVLKDVRQWSNPDRLHKDSVIDGVNYGALKAEELFNQFGESL